MHGTNMGNRDHLLTNIGTAEIFSVRHGTYPGEKKKNLRQRAALLQGKREQRLDRIF